MLARFLQRKAAIVNNIDNKETTRLTSTPANARTLNHLSTLLTRGNIYNEQSRVIAVAAGPLELSGFVLEISSSPTATPTPPPNISPSSSASSNLSELLSSGATPGDTTAAYNADADDHLDRNVLLSRNSDGRRTAGSLTRRMIHTPFPYSLTNRAELLQSVKNPASFEDYVERSIQLLRTAAAEILADSSRKAAIQGTVLSYFVGSCTSKIAQRLKLLLDTYGGLDALGSWSANYLRFVGEEFAVITNAAAAKALTLAGVPRVEDQSRPMFVFNRQTASSWWRSVIAILRYFNTFMAAGDIEMVVASSEALYYLLAKIPAGLWQGLSLAHHLERCRHVQKRQASLSISDPNLKVNDDVFGDDENALLSGPALPGNPRRECEAFYRILNGICAWTTGAKHLLKHRLSTATIPIQISMVDLPRTAVNEVSSKNLMDHWGQLSSWTWNKHTFHKVLKILDEHTNVEAATARACHCEAGIIASFALRQGGAASGEIEPEVLAKAFAAFELQRMSTSQLACYTPTEISSGRSAPPQYCFLVWPSKKPLTRSQFNPQPSRSAWPKSVARYRPWVPPEWLPQPVMESLERQLFDVVVRMLETDTQVATSRASSRTTFSQSNLTFSLAAENQKKDLK
ncbi:hypothetical protein GGX14DRAFT_602013 [Mycena pura]|uniref:Uncharacterized protein n=1 Tax=Mycena pura TaxID=153505 RepID=A0AAD6VM38_9AGAR|nr:hypothetical protein GGX14DRAFT_602013 [Mycena pura]